MINQSLQPLAVTDPMLQQRKQNEVPFIREVSDSLSQRLAVLSWQKEPPTGASGLRQISAEAAVIEK